jgi:hypothetical protein
MPKKQQIKGKLTNAIIIVIKSIDKKSNKKSKKK